MRSSRSHDAVIRVYDAAGNVIGSERTQGRVQEAMSEVGQYRVVATFDECMDAQSQESHIKFLARAQVRSLNGGMKTTPKTRPSNVTSFILEGRWPLAGFDQRELRRLSQTAKRKGVGIADVLYEAVESFIAKCEAEAHLEEKVIKFPTVAQRS